MGIKTEDFVSLMVAILGAMPPDSSFCKIVTSLAGTDAWADFMDKEYGSDNAWEDDQQKLIQELKDKFGDEIDMEEVIKEWEEQAK
ncbi:MAG: hypothetical protein WBV73_17495 [Phormidium sp.]